MTQFRRSAVQVTPYTIPLIRIKISYFFFSTTWHQPIRMVLLIRLVRPKAVFLLLRRNCLFLFVFTGQILQLSCSTLTPDVFPKNVPAAAVPSVHSLFVGIPQFRVLMFCLVTKGSSQLHTIEMTPPAGVADPAKRRHFRYNINIWNFSSIKFFLSLEMDSDSFSIFHEYMRSPFHNLQSERPDPAHSWSGISFRVHSAYILHNEWPFCMNQDHLGILFLKKSLL